MKKPLILLIVILLLTGCGADPAAGEKFGDIISSTADMYEIPAISAGISVDGRLIFSGSAGDSTTDRVSPIGSITKSFVAVLALMLEDEGVISLEDKITRYLPDLDFWNKDNITLKDLLTMHSGIADYCCNFSADDYFREYTRDDLIELGITNSAFSEYGKFEYSNTNILIVATAIENTTGRNIGSLIKERILIPLELDNTFLPYEIINTGSWKTGGFSIMADGSRYDFSGMPMYWADYAAGMYSTAADMIKWGETLNNLTIISSASRLKLFDFLPYDEDSGYGLCIAQKVIQGKEVIVLTGNVPGCSSAIYMTEGICVSVMCILSDYSGNGLSFASQAAEKLLFMTINQDILNTQ